MKRRFPTISLSFFKTFCSPGRNWRIIRYLSPASYAGHYVPAVAHRAFVASKNDEGSVNLNLKGFAIGNGLTDPEIQYAAYAKYSVGVGIATALQSEDVNAKYLETCEKKAKLCNNENGKRYSNATVSKKCIEAVEYCQNIQTRCCRLRLRTKAGKPINVYDVRKRMRGRFMLRFLANREISESKIDSRGARRRQSQVGDVQYGGSREDDGGLDEITNRSFPVGKRPCEG